MKKKNLLGKEKNVMALLLALAFLVLGGLQFIGHGVHEKAFMGSETYYYVRMSGQYQDERVADYDLLQDRPASFNLFHLVPGTKHVPVEAVARALPVIAGLLSLFLFHYLLRALKFKKDVRLVATIIFAASPLFVYVFTSFTPMLLFVPLMLSSIIFYVKKKAVLSAAFFLPATLLSFATIIILLAGLFLFTLFNKDKKYFLVTIFSGALLAGVVSWGLLGFSPGLELVPKIYATGDLFVELAGIKAYSLIILGLAAMGFMVAWERNAKNVTMLLFAVIAFGSSLFFTETRFVFSALITVYAAIAIINLIRRDWNVKIIKNVTLLLVLCSIVFSFVVSIDNAFSQVNAEKINAALYLSVSEQEDVVLSAEENGFMMGYLSGRKAFMDGFSFRHDYYDERREIARSIYYSRDLASLEETLKENNINHLFIDSGMRHGGVWTGGNEGVLFLLRHADEFIMIFNNEEVMIYKYIG